MILKMDTGLGSEVKLTLPDVVQSFHVQHLPHPHSGISASAIVMSDQWHSEGTRRRDGTSTDTKICKPAKLYT